jgi:hypothetical protein
VYDTAGDEATIDNSSLGASGTETDGTVVIARTRILQGEFTPGRRITALVKVSVITGVAYFLMSAGVSVYDQPHDLV